MRTLIVKTGALGDVLRTTILLSELEGEIFWLTKSESKDLLSSKKITDLFFIDNEEDVEKLKKMDFNLVISLEEDLNVLKIISQIKFDKIIGLFLNEHGSVDYTNDSKYWFDMSLVSKYGLEKANYLKKMNLRSHAEIFIEMLGKSFNNQEYDIGHLPRTCSNTIGIIDRVGSGWPNKNWAYYDLLSEALRKQGINCVHLPIRRNLKEHIEDINGCDIIVCGDTLGMHIALALKKKVISLFTCTSPSEIHDYGRMTKIISPLYNEFFYKKTFDIKATTAIPLDSVVNEVLKLLKTQSISAQLAN